MDGRLVGGGIRYGDGKRNNDCTLEWRDTASGIDWPVRLLAPTRFRVAANYATGKTENGGAFVIAAGRAKLAGTVQPTERATDYRTVSLGEIEFPAGDSIVSLRPTEITGGDLMKLRTLELTPIR